MDRIDSVARLKEAELARKQKIEFTNHDDRSIEELMASFSKPNVKNSGKLTFGKVKNVDDDVSVKQNKYNKRFTKTKKPAKL